MKLVFWLILTLFFIESGHSQESKEEIFFNKLDSLASNLDMEYVNNDLFPTINPYGSYGSTFVYGLLDYSENNEISESVLFLCRKRRGEYTPQKEESISQIAMGYKYSLVFAIRKNSDKNFVIHSVIEEGISLMGMSLFYGKPKWDLSEFRYINLPDSLGPKGKEPSLFEGTVPVIISSVSSTKILYLYNNKWLEYSEIGD